MGTQFITVDGTDTGALKEIRRHYVQNGKKIETPDLSVGYKTFNSISTEFCEAEVGLFKDNTNFLQKGGLKAMDAAMESSNGASDEFVGRPQGEHVVARFHVSRRQHRS